MNKNDHKLLAKNELKWKLSNKYKEFSGRDCERIWNLDGGIEEIGNKWKNLRIQPYQDTEQK